MRKQYTFHAYEWGFYVIELYHDGVMIQAIKKDRADAEGYIDKLEAQGYTFGYTDKDIEEARKTYENKRANRIGPEVETYDGEWIPRRWATVHDWGIMNHRSIACSVCSKEFYNAEPTPHCPNCGAKLKRKGDKQL